MLMALQGQMAVHGYGGYSDGSDYDSEGSY